jgi:hypothetical protein
VAEARVQFAGRERGAGRDVAAITVLTAAVAAAFHSLFTTPVSLLVGDSLTHSLPAHHVLAELFAGRSFRFWRPEVALGYPAYADGAGGWLHPLKLVLFACFDWLTAHDLVYVASFWLTGVFAFGTARTLGLRAELALVAGLAAAFSPAVLGNVYNASYAHALAWSAGALFAFERFERRPDLGRGLALAAAIALLLLAGYMPTAYATLLVLGLLWVVRHARAPRVLARRGVALGGAVVLALALAAVQVLPFAELSRHSFRGEDALAALVGFTWIGYVVGLVFVNDPELYRPGGFVFLFSALGSVLAFLGVLWLPRLRGRIAASHGIAILFCVGIANGPDTALYDTLHGVLPGLDRLRVLSPFLHVTAVPTALLLALALDAGLRGAATTRVRRVVGWTALLLLAGLVLMSAPFAATTPAYGATEAALGLLALAGLATARRLERPRLATSAILAALLGEIVLVRAGIAAPVPDAVLAEREPLARVLVAARAGDPEARTAFLSTPRLAARRDAHHTQHWKQADYAGIRRSALRFGFANLNLLAGIRLVDSHDPLPIGEALDVSERIQRELAGSTRRARGSRLMDRFRVRWIVAAAADLSAGVAPDLREVWRDPESAVVVLENPHAAPPGFPPLDAAAARGAPVEPWLPSAVVRALGRLPWVRPETGPAYVVEADRAGWHFVAIPAFPGWSATVDGAPAPLVRVAPAGMAVHVPPGRHEVATHFVPWAFHAGALVSAATVAAIAGAALTARRRGRRPG